MEELRAELDEVKTAIATLEQAHAKLHEEALEDGVIEDDEQRELDELMHSIQAAAQDRNALEAELAEAIDQANEDEEDGGLFSAITDAVGDAVDAVSDAVSAGAKAASSGAEEVTQQIKSALSGSVGRKGNNSGDDVVSVQLLLNKKSAGLVPDGDAGPKTIGAIEKFQNDTLGFKDGRVDPGGQTWNALFGGGGTVEAKDDDNLTEEGDEIVILDEEEGEGAGKSMRDLLDSLIQTGDEMLPDPVKDLLEEVGGTAGAITESITETGEGIFDSLEEMITGQPDETVEESLVRMNARLNDLLAELR